MQSNRASNVSKSLESNRDSLYRCVCKLAPVLARRPLATSTFFESFLKEMSGHESQESGFRLDPFNPGRVRIHRIHNTFLDFPKETKNPFLDSESGFGFFSKKCTLAVLKNTFFNFFFVKQH